MALQISIIDPSDGATLPTAYARITAAAVDVVNRRASATVCIYKDAAARSDDRAPIAIRHLLWEADGMPSRIEPTGILIPPKPSFEDSFWPAAKNDINVFARAYDVLKSYEPEFAAAIDI